MGDNNTMPGCTYCGNHHNYSAEMCKDMMNRPGFTQITTETPVDVAALRRELAEARGKLAEWGKVPERWYSEQTMAAVAKERDEANAKLAAMALDNARLRKLVLNGRCASSQTAANEVWEHEAADLTEGTTPDALAQEVRDGIHRVRDLCFGEPVSVGMPGDYSHADRDHAEAHRLLDALLAKLGMKEVKP